MKTATGRERLKFVARLALWACTFFLLLAVTVVLLPGQVPRWALPGPEPSSGEVTLMSTDRVLILAPHPDDESLACGGVIQAALARGAPVTVTFLTCGDANELSFLLYRRHPVLAPSSVLAMGRVRHDEALAAGAALGLAPSALTFLGYPDAGTFDIWLRHWGSRPMRSVLTRVDAVPYDFALRPGSFYRGEEILRDLTQVIEQAAPTRIFVSHPGDGNGDHRALYLFTRVALWNLGDKVRATLHPYLVHAPRWPRPAGPQPGRPLVPPQVFRTRIPWSALPVGTPENERKQRAIEAHRSQCGYSRDYLLSFVRSCELFGDFAPLVAAPASASPAASYEETGMLGTIWHQLEVRDSSLVLRTGFDRPVGRQANVDLWLFGWRADRPFAAMPKVRVTAGPTGLRAFDGAHRVANAVLEARSSNHERFVRVPLRVLGNPRRLLVSARARMARLSLEPPCWQVVELEGATP